MQSLNVSWFFSMVRAIRKRMTAAPPSKTIGGSSVKVNKKSELPHLPNVDEFAVKSNKID